MSLFDPHSLYVNRQRKTRKGQVLQKKPIPLLRAYTNRDLEEAKRILHAYGIPYGPAPPPPETLSKIDSSDICYSISEVWESPYDQQNVILMDREIFSSYFNTTDFGRWLRQELDLSKVKSYFCSMQAKNITYYYDPAEEPTGDVFNYTMHAYTQDRMSNYDEIINFYDTEAVDPDVPNRYISKSIINYTTDNSPHYVLEFNNMVGDTGFHDRDVTAVDYTDAFHVLKTSETLSLRDFLDLRFDQTILASTRPSGQWRYDTAACISTIASIFFYVEYTE